MPETAGETEGEELRARLAAAETEVRRLRASLAERDDEVRTLRARLDGPRLPGDYPGAPFVRGGSSHQRILDLSGEHVWVMSQNRQDFLYSSCKGEQIFGLGPEPFHERLCSLGREVSGTSGATFWTASSASPR
jgi:hypothetical protein